MNKYTILLLAAIAIIFQSCITLKDTVVIEDEFLGNEQNPQSIYQEAGDNSYINPFNINTDNWGLGAIERLMLAEFEPLSGYKTIELQVISKGDTRGGLVILYHDDDVQADVYHTPNLKLSKEMYENVLNKTVITSSDFQYKFSEENGCLKTYLNMTDRFGKHIEMTIDEQEPEMKPVGLLAPIGGKAAQPRFMTIVFMQHFRFLAQSEKNISVKIDGTQAEMTTLPISINGTDGYQTKYSMSPVTVSWNVNQNGQLKPIQAKNNKYSQDDIEIEIQNNNGHPEIFRFTGLQSGHKVYFRFAPPIPDLCKLKQGAETEGRFAMGIDTTQGIIAGEYTVERKGNEITLVIEPTEGYSPVPGTAWMKCLTWTATIDLSDSAAPKINSEWTKD